MSLGSDAMNYVMRTAQGESGDGVGGRSKLAFSYWEEDRSAVQGQSPNTAPRSECAPEITFSGTYGSAKSRRSCTGPSGCASARPSHADDD